MRAALPWLALALAGCTTVDVTTQLEPGAELARYRTYVLAPAPWPGASAPSYTEAAGERLLAEIARQLDARGYRDAGGEPADLLVAFHVSGESRSRMVNAADPDTDYYVEQHYVEGTLMIEVLDNLSRQPLWRGSGTRPIFRERDAERAGIEAVRAILAELPPAPAWPR